MNLTESRNAIRSYNRMVLEDLGTVTAIQDYMQIHDMTVIRISSHAEKFMDFYNANIHLYTEIIQEPKEDGEIELPF